MSENYKVGDKIIFNESIEGLKGVEGEIIRIIGCSCKANAQSAIIKVNESEYKIENFRSKVKIG